MWIGISAEENARRCKPSQEAWVTNRYPLRELGLNRADCEAWLLKHHQIVVSKSACLGCLMWNIGRGTTTPVGRDGPLPEGENYAGDWTWMRVPWTVPLVDARS